MAKYSEVYPRTHGETCIKMVCYQKNSGLSPYTRGNLGFVGKTQNRRGSIPVHTGKPKSQSKKTFLTEVYPRTHGETTTGEHHE